MTDLGDRRGWVPDINEMARQIIEDYRTAAPDGDFPEGGGAYARRAQGNLDALATIESWQETAKAHGEEITEDDLISLVQRLASIAAEKPKP